MNIVIDKLLVKKQFDNGLRTYDSYAQTQRNVTSKLVQMVIDIGFEHFSKVFEVGCGSGLLTRKLIENLRIEELIVNDITNISQEHINNISRHCNKKIDFLCGDAEEILFPQSNNAVFSSSTIQWFNCLTQFFDKVNTSLNPKGLFVFSTFGLDNFNEIKSLTGVGLEYHKMEILQAMLSKNFDVLAKKEWIEIMEFEHPVNVLRHMKQTGVNSIRQKYFGKDELSEFTQKYAKQFITTRQTVTLTYNPIIIIAQKK
jgi:malonyl-CoA O-methyltransferase